MISKVQNKESKDIITNFVQYFYFLQGVKKFSMAFCLHLETFSLSILSYIRKRRKYVVVIFKVIITMTVIPIRIHMFILQYNNDCYSYSKYICLSYNITMTVIPIRIHMFILQYNNDCYSYSNTYVYLTI